MDPWFVGFSDNSHGNQFQPQNLMTETGYGNIYLDQEFRELGHNDRDNLVLGDVDSVPCMNYEDGSQEDANDAILCYISQMLMEEDMVDQACMLQESLEFQAAEKSFYEVLGKKYPPVPEGSVCHLDRGYDNLFDENSRGQEYNCFADLNSCVGDYVCYGSGEAGNDVLNGDQAEFTISQPQQSSGYCNFHSFDRSSNCVMNGPSLDSFSSSSFCVPDICPVSQSVWFLKGIEEASKFLPNDNKLSIKFDANGILAQEPNSTRVGVEFDKDIEVISPGKTRCRKNLHRGDENVEQGRKAKQAALYIESPLRSELIDKVLLYSRGEGRQHLNYVRGTLRNKVCRDAQQSGKSKGSSGRKGRNKKQAVKRDVVDLRSLMVACAQAVAADDHRSATEFLKQIRQHSSPFEDGNQRLAHCFAYGLEARLASTGSQIYKGLISAKRSAADYLKAYHLYLAASPFGRISNFAAVKTIKALAKNTARLHVIDFGIVYGFQWPTLINGLARDCGTVKLKITGIDFPQPGFRPAERVIETGDRLTAYANSFNLPFEYNPIAKSWEYIQVEDLKIDQDEVIVVNCFNRFENLSDEVMEEESSRDIVLNLIQRIKPHIFLQQVINAAYNVPFFVTRFREALFHFSSLFDMLETIVPRENPERFLLETEIFGREALNVIACEGWDRVERPETYKQWQLRNLKAGFVQVPFERPIVDHIMNKMRSSYHENFLIDEDSKWLLQGWKGRIIYALSAWKPA